MTPIIIGIVGLLLGFGVTTFLNRTANSKKIEEMNRQADLIVKEARLSAKRMTDEAEMASEKAISKAETANEKIKQKKIQEARDRFADMKLKFDESTAQQKIELKELELQVKSVDAEIKSKQEDIKRQKDELETKETEVTAIRENLERQIGIVQRKKEDLDKANETHIKALEQVAKLTELDAKEQLLTAVKAKTENDALVIVREGIEQARLNASKEAKKIVIQTIQRMASEFTIENTVSVFNL